MQSRSPAASTDTAKPASRQRMRAAASIASKRRGGHVLDDLRQSGGAKIRLPRGDGRALSAVLLNTAGGLTGGDELRWHAAAGRCSRLSVATAASEKIYRTDGPASCQITSLTVASGARLDWLPQETILFDGARLERALEAQLAADARLLAVEALAFGRQASGETLRTAAVHDTWRVYREGRLLHAESLRIDREDWHDRARGRGTLHGVGAAATVLYCAADGDEALTRLADELHAMIEQPTVSAIGGASAMSGRVVLRLVARSGFELRRILIPCLARLQDDAPVPRVWHV